MELCKRSHRAHRHRRDDAAIDQQHLAAAYGRKHAGNGDGGAHRIDNAATRDRHFIAGDKIGGDHGGGDEQIFEMTMTEMLSLLPAERFIRVHKSYIVAVDSIQKIERHQLALAKATIPIGELYRDGLERLLLR
jgi:hypothetical protein